jgi:hypothetical protein
MANSYKNLAEATEQTDNTDLRHLWGKKVKSVYEFLKKQFDSEARHYVRMYRHEFSGLLPERLLLSDRVDVNVIYPIVKTLIPNLYFQDPRVYVKALQEKIVKPVTEVIADESGMEIVQPIIDQVTLQPMIQEYDAVRSALIFQNALNGNLDSAKVKNQVKMAIMDAHMMFYGAIKCGWGNDQGVASMGLGAPPSVREDVDDALAYAIRLKPWNVVVDMTDFYNPEWIAVRYTVHPEQLKQDKRLRNREQIEGQSQIDPMEKDKYWKFLDKDDTKQTEYFEVYVKPCAKYPLGKFFIFTDEVKDDFLYDSDWPYMAKDFPIKLLYFNPDPEGGLPVPDVKYYANHQKAKLNLRNAEYEFVQRTMPIFGIDLSGIKDQATVSKQITNGQIPRVVACTRNPQRVLGGVSYPSLSIDFRNLDINIDNDISRVVGLVAPVTPSANAENQLASALKLADKGEQIRQNERADVVSDFLTSVVEYWAKLYQEFAGPENYTTIEGEKFPVKWSRDEINGKFLFKIKPFSMSYEDPVIRRRQWVDLLNLLAAPETRMALSEQGVQVDVAKIIRRILETYDERDVESFVIDDMEKPENQVANAIQENEALSTGQLAMVQVAPTDNHKLHILIHGLLGDLGMEHMLAHQQALVQQATMSSPGGGNVEGLPVNGVAVSQEQIAAPLKQSVTNKRTAIEREAKKK